MTWVLGAVLLLASCAALGAALACSSDSPDSPGPTTSPAATPGGSDFVLEGVYRGVLGGGSKGKIALMVLADGRVFMGGWWTNIPCEDGTVSQITLDSVRPAFTATRRPGDLEFKDAVFRFSASRTEPETLRGTIAFVDRVLEEAGPTCLPGEASITAQFQGAGTELFILNYLDALPPDLAVDLTPDQARRRFQASCECSLPD